MTAPANAKLTPLEQALVGLIARQHGISTTHVPADRIVANVQHSLRHLVQLGWLSSKGDAYHAERVR